MPSHNMPISGYEHEHMDPPGGRGSPVPGRAAAGRGQPHRPRGAAVVAAGTQRAHPGVPQGEPAHAPGRRRPRARPAWRRRPASPPPSPARTTHALGGPEPGLAGAGEARRSPEGGLIGSAPPLIRAVGVGAQLGKLATSTGVSAFAAVDGPPVPSTTLRIPPLPVAGFRKMVNRSRRLSGGSVAGTSKALAE